MCFARGCESRPLPELADARDESQNHAGVVDVLLLGQQRSHPRGYELTAATGVAGQSLDCDLALLQGLEESLRSCFVVATSTAPTPELRPTKRAGKAGSSGTGQRSRGGSDRIVRTIVSPHEISRFVVVQKMRERVVAAHDHVIAVDHLIQDAEVGDGEGRADTQPFCLTCGPGDRAAAEIGAENAVPVPSQSECLGADATGAVQDVHCHSERLRMI